MRCGIAHHARSQQATGFVVPGGTHFVAIDGFLAARAVSTFTALIAPGLLTVTVIRSPVRNGFLMNEASDTVPNAFFFVKPLPFRPFGHALPAHVTVTVEPSGTFFTCNVDSFVVFFV